MASNQCMQLVNEQSSAVARARRSKSDSEIVIFDSLDRESKSKLTAARITHCYGTLKATKKQSSASNSRSSEKHKCRRSYDDDRRRSTLKSQNRSSNTLPRRTRCPCMTNSSDDVVTKRQRSKSLPADIKFIQRPATIGTFELNITTPPSIANETENSHRTTTNPAAPDCGVDDHFVFEAVLAQQQDTVEMNRPRQYGRRLNTSINNSQISRNNTSSSSSSSSARLSDYECSQIAHDCCENETTRAIENCETIDSMLGMENSNSDSLSSMTIESSSANRQHNTNNSSSTSPPSSSFLRQSPRLEAIIRELGPRFCQTDQNNATMAVDDGWPISISRPITCLFCCMGMFNFLRFAISTIIYGGNFLIQFLLLSLFFGIPFVSLQMVLGQRIRKSIVTLFRISPICKGIGISLIISHCILCLYSAVSIGWMMIYLR